MRSIFLALSLFAAVVIAIPAVHAQVPRFANSDNLYKTRLVELARADLASRLGTEKPRIDLVSITAKVWPDTALGCPQPGQLYAQVLTQGYLIVLEAAGREYRYHSDQKRVVLCEAGRK